MRFQLFHRFHHPHHQSVKKVKIQKHFKMTLEMIRRFQVKLPHLILNLLQTLALEGLPFSWEIEHL